jgi:hypothetical protein
MTEGLPNSFLYEHCDVPAGQSLAEWRTGRRPQQQRRAQLTGGLVAALATFAPIVLSVRGSRTR